jgi:hypothetical protein
MMNWLFLQKIFYLILTHQKIKLVKIFNLIKFIMKLLRKWRLLLFILIKRKIIGEFFFFPFLRSIQIDFIINKIFRNNHFFIQIEKNFQN